MFEHPCNATHRTTFAEAGEAVEEEMAAPCHRHVSNLFLGRIEDQATVPVLFERRRN